MDFTGQGRFTAYKLNRPLTDQEKADKLDRRHKLSTNAVDQLSVIKVNSTYMELVDRWYAPKGWSVIFSIGLSIPILMMIVFVPLIALE